MDGSTLIKCNSLTCYAPLDGPGAGGVALRPAEDELLGGETLRPRGEEEEEEKEEEEEEPRE